MKILKPDEVNKMQDGEEVYVNRIAINSRIVELNLQESTNDEAKNILNEAIRSIKQREKGKRVVVWGAKMSVRDIRSTFVNIENMPTTSFAIFS